MMALIGAPIDIQLAREHVRELEAAAEQYRRGHPRPESLVTRHTKPSKRVATGIRRALTTAVHRGPRAGVATREHQEDHPR